jgi:hypothetical protein
MGKNIVMLDIKCFISKLLVVFFNKRFLLLDNGKFSFFQNFTSYLTY